MIIEFRLPDVGEGLTEAELVAWHVSTGDTIAVGQGICDIETAKAVVELPSPHAGTIELVGSPGDVMAVGDVIARITTTEAAENPEPAPDAPNPAALERQAVLVGYGVSETTNATRRPRTHATTPTAPTNTLPLAVAPRVLASPLVRKLAKELGVDLADVTPTGARGQVTRDDVTAASASTDPMSTPDAVGQRIPVRGVHRAMSEAMTRSAATIPAASLWLSVDMTEVTSLVSRIKAHGVRITPTAFVAWAIARACTAHPLLNSTWDDNGPSVILNDAVNLGIAAATERGLLVPVLVDAGALNVGQLAETLGGLVDAARDGRLTPAQMTGATITLTNVGALGMDGGMPIVPPGTTAIVACGRIADTPVAVDGQVVIRPTMTLSMSFDHRVADGAQASAFLADVAATLADPTIAALVS